MRAWLFEASNIRDGTPSRKDRIDLDTENRYRREGVRLIMDVGSALKLAPYPSLATAAVYFHRFYMYHSFTEFNRYVTALACLFLAGKVEETPKKCRDLIQTARTKMEEQNMSETDLNVVGKNAIEDVMSAERVLLQTIKFDLQVEHPYQFLLRYAKILRQSDKEKLQKMLQMAWTFVNDSLCTTLCLQWESEVIAIALMYLASRLSKVEITDWEGRKGTSPNEKWWDLFVTNMTMDLMEEICHQVLDLYSTATSSKSPTAPGPSQSIPPAAPQSAPPKSSHKNTPPIQTGAAGGTPPVVGSVVPSPRIPQYAVRLPVPPAVTQSSEYHQPMYGQNSNNYNPQYNHHSNYPPNYNYQNRHQYGGSQ